MFMDTSFLSLTQGMSKHVLMFACVSSVLELQPTNKTGNGECPISHVVKLDIELNDLEAIRRAVKRIGGIWKEDQKTYAWWGRSVGDYPLPDGFTADQLGKCDHAFGFDGASWEVGVVRKPNGTFTLLWDFYSSGNLMPFMGNQQGHKFTQAYGVERAKLEAQRNGLVVREVTLPNGSIQLRAGKV